MSSFVVGFLAKFKAIMISRVIIVKFKQYKH